VGQNDQHRQQNLLNNNLQHGRRELSARTLATCPALESSHQPWTEPMYTSGAARGGEEGEVSPPPMGGRPKIM